MKKVSILFLAFVGLVSLTFGQDKYFTKTATISFFSETAMENIEATNKAVTSMITSDGKVAFIALIKSFEFEKALMQEHFNENYMESEKFPKAKFDGKITNMEDVDFAKAGTYKVNVAGTLEIHGVKKDVQTDGELTVVEKKGKTESVKVKASFIAKPADYDIKIPSVVKDNIAKEIEVKVDASLPLKI